MIYLADVSWAQIILVEIGALLQFIALCQFVRERNAYRIRAQTKEKSIDPHEQKLKMAEQAALLRAIRAGPLPNQGRDDDVQTEVRAADLLKTAKVKFVQSFKFRPNDS